MEPIEILLDTPQAVVCVKPAGVLSQDGAPGQAAMPQLLAAQLSCAIYPIHRLDRPVGGVMVYAKTRPAAGALSRQLQQGRMEKEYLAALKGVPAQEAGLLRDLLYHDPRRNKTFVVSRPRKGVREARLLYRVLDTQGEHALVQVRLLTGRSHQIRAQFAARGLPLMGDGRYGGGSGQVQLWAMGLTLELPGLGKRRLVRLPKALGPFAALQTPAPLDAEFLENCEKALDKSPAVE